MGGGFTNINNSIMQTKVRQHSRQVKGKRNVAVRQHLRNQRTNLQNAAREFQQNGYSTFPVPRGKYYIPTVKQQMSEDRVNRELNGGSMKRARVAYDFQKRKRISLATGKVRRTGKYFVSKINNY